MKTFLLIFLVVMDFCVGMEEQNWTSNLQNYTSWNSKESFIIEEKDSLHEKMIRKVIEIVSGSDTRIITFDNAPNISYETIETLEQFKEKEEEWLKSLYEQITGEVKKKEGPIILNLSGDLAVGCYFLTLFDNEEDDLQEAIQNNDLKQVIEDNQIEPGKDQFLCRIYKNSQQENTSLRQLEHKKQRLTLENGKAFYGNLFQTNKNKLLLIAAMGNRVKFNEVDALFSPIRQSILDNNVTDNTIFVVNVTEHNALEEDSEMPHSFVRGSNKIKKFDQYNPFYEEYNNLLQPLNDLSLLQASTISVRGEWEAFDTDNSRDRIHHTSAAAAVLSGFLVKLQNAFPLLNSRELKEAILNSAERDFHIPTSIYTQAKNSYEIDIQSENANVDSIHAEFFHQVLRSNNPGNPETTESILTAIEKIREFAKERGLGEENVTFESFYGHGLFNAQRAFHYAGFLNQCRQGQQINQDENYQNFCVASNNFQKRRELFNEIIKK